MRTLTGIRDGWRFEAGAKNPAFIPDFAALSFFNPSVTLGTDPASFHFGKGGQTSRAKNNKGNELQHANASMKKRQ